MPSSVPTSWGGEQKLSEKYQVYLVICLKSGGLKSLVLPLVIETKWLFYADALHHSQGQFQITPFHGSVPRAIEGNILRCADLG